MSNEANNKLIPPHGGYRKLMSYHIAEIVYDATIRFCERFIDKRSRTFDKMVQAARSGKQKIIILVDKILSAHISAGSVTDAEFIEASVSHADTSEWEREIDRLVYQLYDLTEEEIEIVEGKSVAE